MNIIKTVGDIKKALSVYDDALPFEFRVILKDGSEEIVANNNNDTMFRRELNGNDPAKFVIVVIEE